MFLEPSGGGFQTIVYDAHPSHKKLNISYKDQNITLFLLLGKHGYASDFSNENLQISTFLNFLKEKQSDRKWKQMKYFTHILYYITGPCHYPGKYTLRVYLPG
jgi:hypothetical protein